MRRSVRSFFRLSSGILSAGLVALVTLPAPAAPVSISMPVQGTTPTTGFTAQLNATGTVTLSGSGAVNRGYFFGNFLGTQGFNLSPQTAPITLNGGAISVGTNAAGNIGLTYENSSTGLAPISIDSANIDLLNGATIPISFNPVNINASTSVIGINVPINLTINAGGALNLLNFGSTGSSATSPAESNPGSYAIPGLFDLGGNISATGAGSVLGIGFDLGSVLNETISETDLDLFSGGGLPGLATLSEIVTGNPLFEDLGANYQLPNLGITIPLEINESGTVSENLGEGDLGTLNNFTLNYLIDLDLTLTNLSYNVSGTVTDGVQVVPEPGSVLLAGLGLVGLVVGRLRRRK